MAGKKTEDIVRCSFCNKTQSQVRKMIAGPSGTYICDDCVEVCAEIIEEEMNPDSNAGCGRYIDTSCHQHDDRHKYRRYFDP